MYFLSYAYFDIYPSLLIYETSSIIRRKQDYIDIGNGQKFELLVYYRLELLGACTKKVVL